MGAFIVEIVGRVVGEVLQRNDLVVMTKSWTLTRRSIYVAGPLNSERTYTENRKAKRRNVVALGDTSSLATCLVACQSRVSLQHFH